VSKKNLIHQTNDFANHIIGQNVFAELVELSEKDLQSIVGGCDCACCYANWFKNQPPIPPLNLPKPKLPTLSYL
jgi:bacteriocin-like protein